MTEVALSGVPQPVGSAGRIGLRGLERGVEAHLAYQGSALRSVPGFEAEVRVSGVRTRGEWRASVAGRCDGVRPLPGGGFVVEELKRVAGGRAGAVLRAAAEMQAAVYAWLLEAARGAACAAELVWLGAGGRVLAREAAGLGRARALAQLDEAIDRAIAAALAQQEELARRRAAASAVGFPFPALRRGQAEIAAHCESSLAAREQLLLEAPTGLGKTAAVLPAALRFALANDLQLYVLTSRTLQQRLAIETLQRSAPPGLRVAARLRSKSRMCATGDLQCHEEICSFARTHRGAVAEQQLVPRAFAAGLALPDAVFALASESGACPYELQAEAARSACATVADTNYAFDPVVALAELRDPDSLARAVLVIDEAHALPARARDALTARLDAAQLRAGIEQAALGGSALHARQRELAEALLAALEAQVADSVGEQPDACVLGGFAAAEAERWREEVEAELDATVEELGGAPVLGPHAAFLELAFGALGFLDAPSDGTHRALAGRAGGHAYLERACIDPAPALARVLGGAHAVIAMSATLSPPDWHARLLGVDPARFSFARVDGEQRGERLRVVIDAKLATTFDARAKQTPKLARRVAALADAVPGNVLVVAPSFAWLAQLARALEDAGRTVALERPGADPRERERWLAALRGARGVLALAVAGGAFTEGFDSAGLGLSAIAVLGPCIPALAPRRELEREHYEEQLGDGFALAYALPGMTRVIQSAGRLLRREADRGVVALYGERFLREPYRSLLPEAWLRGGSAEDLAGDPARAARAFFAVDPGPD